jgi:hypothetical protein
MIKRLLSSLLMMTCIIMPLCAEEPEMPVEEIRRIPCSQLNSMCAR